MTLKLLPGGGRFDKEAEPRRQPRVLLIDIETNNLRADFGWILCASYMMLNEDRPKTISLRHFPKLWKQDPTNDREVAAGMLDAIRGADVIVGHYAQRFDRKFINTRLLKWGLPPLPPVPLVDTWRLAKDNLALSSNRLKSIERFFELDMTEDGFKKTELSADAWRRAPTGHLPSLKYVEQHCEADVIQLKKVYMILRSAATSHPNLSVIAEWDGCPICGVVGLMKLDGTRLARTGVAQRFFCGACRGYSHSPYKRVKEAFAR